MCDLFVTHTFNQFTLLSSETKCNNILAPLKKLFKSHINLPKSTHNNIIHNKLFPSIHNFFLNQIYAHCVITNVI